MWKTEYCSNNVNRPNEFIVYADCYNTECKIMLSFDETLEIDSVFELPYPIVSESSALEALKDISIDISSGSFVTKKTLSPGVSTYPSLWPESVVKTWDSWPNSIRNELRKIGWSQRDCQKIIKTKEWQKFKETQDPVYLIPINKMMPSMLAVDEINEWPSVSVIIGKGQYVPGVKHEGIIEYHITQSDIFEEGPLIIVRGEYNMEGLTCVIRDKDDFQTEEFWKINPNDSELSFVIGSLNTEYGVTIQSIIYPSSIIKSQAIEDCKNRNGTLIDNTGEVIQFSVSGSANLPLANRQHEWSASAAMKRVRSWAAAISKPNEKYRSAFFYYDSDNADNFTAYKLQFANIVNGKLTAIPRGIFAVAAVLQGARGGVDIPDSDKAKIKSKVAAYYAKMRREFDDETIVVPWAQ
jgi:hypothetical protein